MMGAFALTLLFFPINIVTERFESISRSLRRIREEDEVLMLSFDDYERNRRKVGHDGTPVVHHKCPDDGDDAPSVDPATVADGELGHFRHPGHLFLTPGGAAA